MSNRPKTPESLVSVALYARISEDRTDDAAGIERQLADCQKLAESRGWKIVGRYSDNNISALRGRSRPQYEALMADVAAGRVDRIIVWQLSRLWRNRIERVTALDVLRDQRCGVIAVKGPDLDLSTAYGRAMLGLLGEFDTMESEVKGERVAAAAAQRARTGKPNGGLGYGWRKTDNGEWVLQQDEAKIIRSIAKKLLDPNGEATLIAVTSWLNESRVPPPGASHKRSHRAHVNPDGSRWNKTSVKKLMLRPSNAGLRVHHKGREDETLTDGGWMPILDPMTWERVVTKLSAPERKIARPANRRHLLSWGVGYCGVCGSVLRVSMKGHATYGTKQPTYVCDSNSACVGRNEAKVDARVAAAVIERLSQPDAIEVLARDDHRAGEAATRIRKLQTRLDDAADSYASGTITRLQLERISGRLQAELDQAEADRRRYTPRPVDTAVSIAGPDAEARWFALGLSRHRAILEELGLKVYIDPVKRRGPGFDPDTVRIVWP